MHGQCSNALYAFPSINQIKRHFVKRQNRNGTFYLTTVPFVDYIKLFIYDVCNRFMILSVQDAMKNRLTFLLIASRIGVQHRFSMHKKIFYLFILFLLLLIGGGSVGVWKANENLELTQKKQLLETQHRQMQTMSSTVETIEQQEIAIRDLLGIKDNPQPPVSEANES
jgi:magnesium-transporting ATPase (P-type)